MKKILLIFTTLLSMVIFNGCSSYDDNSDFTKDGLGSYSFTPLNIEPDEILHVAYHGDEIRIPYRVEGLAPEIVSEFGWLVFVDGLLQPTRLETMTGDIFRKSEYLHVFDLKYREYLEFYVVFKPVSGKLGTDVSFMTGALLQPSFLPNDVSNPIFEPFHNLFAPVADVITIYHEILDSNVGYSDVVLVDISDNLLEQEMAFLASNINVFEHLLEFPRIEIIPYDQPLQINYEDLMLAENGHVRLQLLVYGGREVTNRITFFVNHEPVKANGVDFFEIQMKEGKMAVVDVVLQLEELNHFNSLYAIMMTTGDEFHVQGMFKSPSLLLVNE